MTSVISKTETIGNIKEILNKDHDISTPFGWEIVFAMLLKDCTDHIEVHGYGEDAYFTQI